MGSEKRPGILIGFPGRIWVKMIIWLLCYDFFGSGFCGVRATGVCATFYGSGGLVVAREWGLETGP